MDPNLEYIVLVNEEEQHSLWPRGKEIPTGWKQVGPTGSMEDCTAWIDENWTDMRPLSQRPAS